MLDLGVQPDVAPDKWRLRVEGLVQAPVRLTLPEFMALPQTELVNDIHCVTQWSRYDNHWQGVRARDLIALARPKDEARFVSFTSYDGYTTNVPLSEFTADEVLLAHSWEGAPLTRQHGGPVRVVLPRLYFWKSPKWVTPDRAAARRPARLLGSPRLPQQRRPLGGGAVWLRSGGGRRSSSGVA